MKNALKNDASPAGPQAARTKTGAAPRHDPAQTRRLVSAAQEALMALNAKGSKARRATVMERAQKEVCDALARGANPNVPVTDDNDGWAMPALTALAMGGLEDAVAAMLAAGAAVNAVDRGLRSATWRAAEQGKDYCVKRLLSAGADIEERDEDGNGLLWAACGGDRGSQDCVDLLIDSGARLPEPGSGRVDSLLALAAKVAEARLPAMLLDVGASPNARDKHGCTALGWACAMKERWLVERLLAAGADVDALDADVTGFAPMHVAAQSGDMSTMTLLLGAGARLDAPTAESGCTPLMIAVRNGRVAAAKTLLALGANPNARSRARWAPLDMAIYMDKGSLVKALVAAGAEMEAKDFNGDTPAMGAVKNGSGKAALALLECGANFHVDKNGPKSAMAWARRNHPVMAAKLEAHLLGAATPRTAAPKAARLRI